MHTAVELITPERAKEMLLRAKPNRAINERKALEIAVDMESGQWKLNGETIIVAPSGRILDGQHRLTACVLANKPFTAVVVYDTPEDVFDTIDSGRVRTASDILRTKGYDATTMTAAAARYAYNYIGGFASDHTVPRLAITKFVDTHPYLNSITKLVDAKGKRYTRTALAVVLFLANTNRSYETEMTSFLDGINTGINLQYGDPRLTLREWYVAERSRVRRGSGVITSTAIAAAIRAWNAYVTGKPLTSIRKIDTLDRDTMPIVGFERVKYRDVPESSAKERSAASKKSTTAKRTPAVQEEQRAA